MKYIVISLLTLSCVNYESFDQRIERQGRDFCKCHEGVEYLTYNVYQIELLCKDGKYHSAKGYVDTHNIIGDCK